MIECSSYQIDLAPSLDPRVGVLINVSEDHLDRHGTLNSYAAIKERLVANVQRDGTAIVGVDDNWCQAAADRIERHGRQRRARVGAPAAGRRPLRRGRHDHAGERRHRAADRPHRRHRFAARPAQRAERGLRDRRGAGARARRRQRSSAGCARSLGSRTAWSRSAARAPCCSSTISRRPMPTPPRARSPASTISSGSPAARRRPAASPRLTGFFPRIRKAYLIGEAAEDFAATLAGRAARDRRRRSIAPSSRRRAMPRLRAPAAGRAAVARLRLVRPVPAISRCAAPSSAIWCALCRASPENVNRLETIRSQDWSGTLAQPGDGHDLAHRALAVRRLVVDGRSAAAGRARCAHARRHGALARRRARRWRPGSGSTPSISSTARCSISSRRSPSCSRLRCCRPGKSAASRSSCLR